MRWSISLFSLDEENVKWNIRELQEQGWRVFRYWRYRYWDGYTKCSVEMWRDW